MYSKVSSCVRSHNETSDFFDFPTGLRQGETISPILVSLFLEDLELFLQQDPDSSIKLDQLTIIISRCIMGILGQNLLYGLFPSIYAFLYMVSSHPYICLPLYGLFPSIYMPSFICSLPIHIYAFLHMYSSHPYICLPLYALPSPI